MVLIKNYLIFSAIFVPCRLDRNDIEEICSDGFEVFGNGSVCLTWINTEE